MFLFSFLWARSAREGILVTAAFPNFMSFLRFPYNEVAVSCDFISFVFFVGAKRTCMHVRDRGIAEFYVLLGFPYNEVAASSDCLFVCMDAKRTYMSNK